MRIWMKTRSFGEMAALRAIEVIYRIKDEIPIHSLQDSCSSFCSDIIDASSFFQELSFQPEACSGKNLFWDITISPRCFKNGRFRTKL